MNKALITLHGQLGEVVGRSWALAVLSVSEAIRAIDILSGRKFFKFLYENDRHGLKYKVIVNGREFRDADKLDPKNLETIRNCELCMNLPSLKTIDIIPVLEGSDQNTWTIIAGALLIVIGIVVIIASAGTLSFLGGALIVAGLGLVAAGVMNLLAPQPKFEDFREVQGGGSTSYLFSGPQNVAREGGPVPIGYGRLIIGSQVISASYEISHKNANDNPLTS